MKQFKEYLVESSKKREHTPEESAGYYIANLIDTHDKSGVESDFHPMYNGEALQAMREYYLGTSHPDDPDYVELADPERLAQNRDIITYHYPHLDSVIDMNMPKRG